MRDPRRTALGAKTEELLDQRRNSDRALRLSDLDTVIAELVLKVVQRSGGGGSLDGLSDVVIAAPALGDVVKYDGTNWVNDTGAGGASGQAVLDFGTYGEDATVDVTGQAGILAGSECFVTVAVTDTPENTVADIFMDPPIVLAGNIVAATGFTIYGRAIEGGLHGRINVNWEWR